MIWDICIWCQIQIIPMFKQYFDFKTVVVIKNMVCVKRG